MFQQKCSKTLLNKIAIQRNKNINNTFIKKKGRKTQVLTEMKANHYKQNAKISNIRKIIFITKLVIKLIQFARINGKKVKKKNKN